MIYFFSLMDILIVFGLIFMMMIGVTTSVVDFIMHIMKILFIICILKNLFFDIRGLIKCHNNILYMLWGVCIDVLRTLIFFGLVNSYITAYRNAAGIISFLARLLDFVLVFSIGGIIYLCGEFCSLSHGIKDVYKENKLVCIASDMFFLLILFAFYWFATI